VDCDLDGLYRNAAFFAIALTSTLPRVAVASAGYLAARVPARDAEYTARSEELVPRCPPIHP
jgi:hypothetical protein